MYREAAYLSLSKAGRQVHLHLKLHSRARPSSASLSAASEPMNSRVHLHLAGASCPTLSLSRARPSSASLAAASCTLGRPIQAESRPNSVGLHCVGLHCARA